MPDPVTRRVGPGPAGGACGDIAPGKPVKLLAVSVDGGEARHARSGEEHDSTIEKTIDWGRKVPDDATPARDPAGVPDAMGEIRE